MMKSLVTLGTLLGIGLLGSTAHAANKNKSDPDGLVTCGTTTESRTLAIATKDAGCELHYEKYGKDKVISWSSHNPEVCRNSRDKVRKELEDAGWKCVQE